MPGSETSGDSAHGSDGRSSSTVFTHLCIQSHCYAQLGNASSPYVVWSALIHGSNRVSKCAKENHMFFRLAGFSYTDKSLRRSWAILKPGIWSVSLVLCTSEGLVQLSKMWAARLTLFWVRTGEIGCLTWTTISTQDQNQIRWMGISLARLLGTQANS